MPIACLGSVAIAILVDVLAFIVAIGDMSFEAVVTSRDFAASGSFLGAIGFGAHDGRCGAASAIKADFFGAATLPVSLARADEPASAIQRPMRGQSDVSLLVVGRLARWP